MAMSDTISCISKKESSRMLQVITELSGEPEFSLTIVSMATMSDRVVVAYLVGHHDHVELYQEPSEDDYSCNSDSSSEAESVEDLEKMIQEKYSGRRMQTTEGGEVTPTDEVINRDLAQIEDRLHGIVPAAKIEINKLKQLPRFISTDGVSSKLICVDGSNRRLHIGCTTAFLIGESRANQYALSVGYRTNVDDKIYIKRQEDEAEVEIGKVVERIVGNETFDGACMYVDAALILLNENVIESLNLTQRFCIDQRPHILHVDAQPPHVGRVILRAVDQISTDAKGWILSSCLNLLLTPRGPMLGCTQIARFEDDGRHNGFIHSEGESGMLGTYQPTPDLGARVYPVVMLIGLLEFETSGECILSSIGIDLEGIVNILNGKINDKLKFMAGPLLS